MADNIRKINASRTATPNKLYYDKDGNVYIGTPNGRLKLKENTNNSISVTRTTNSNTDEYSWTLGNFELNIGEAPILNETLTIAWPGVFPTDIFHPQLIESDKDLFNISMKAGNGNVTITISSNVFISGTYKINYIRYVKI